MNLFKRAINDHTPISIGLLITIIGAIAWANNYLAKAQDVSEIKAAQIEYNKSLTKIDERLSKIEGYLSK
jgi:hypothetical protein